jgi:RimJ/RimL family protein N-acetyltransferase
MQTIIKKGLSDNQIRQLIEYATSDPDVVRFTSDPERFKDRASYDAWVQKNPVIYTLTNDEGDLLGVIWFEKKPLPGMADLDTTFAIRVYGEARGKGEAYSFMKSVFEEAGIKRVWLSTSAENEVAVRLYIKFGFRIISKPDSSNRIYMIYDQLN